MSGNDNTKVWSIKDIEGLERLPPSIFYPSDPAIDVDHVYLKPSNAVPHQRLWGDGPNPLRGSEWDGLKPQVVAKLRAAGLAPVVIDIHTPWDKAITRSAQKGDLKLHIWVEKIPGIGEEGEKKAFEAMKEIHGLCGVGFVEIMQCPKRDATGQFPAYIKGIIERMGGCA